MIVVVDQGVEQTEDLRLGGPRGRVVRGERRVDALLPALLGVGVLGLVGRVDAVVALVQCLGQRFEGGAGIGDERQRGKLVGVEAGDVEVEEADRRVREEGGGGGGEVGVAGADADDQVGGTGQFVGGRGAGVADAADVGGVVVAQRTLAGLGGGDGDPGGGGQCGEGLLGRAVMDPAACDDQRPAGGAHGPYRPFQFVGVGCGAAYVPDALGEELLRPVVRLRLHVLRQRECDGAGLRRVGEGPHGLEGGRNERFGAGDPVEVAGDGAQAVVDGEVARGRDFELLEHGVGGAGREDVAGEEEDGEMVDGGEGGAGDEVGGAGADGGGDGVRGEAAGLAGVADGGVHHGLLVAALEEGHGGPPGGYGPGCGGPRLQEGLADSGDVAVAEDAPGGADQTLSPAVALGVLAGEEGHQGLGGGEPAGAHRGAS